jgi:predicted Zn-dependent protease
VRADLTRRFPVALLFALAAAGCATNPVSGRPELVLVSAEREQQLGREEAQRVEQEMGRLPEPALQAYVESVGRRLAAQSPRRDVDYRFQVVDSPEPNAFALPGGYVYVTRGLLIITSSEDELATVIGHEIGHVAARHSVQQISRAAPLAVVTGLGAALTGLVSPSLGRAVAGAGGAASQFVLAPFGRDQEREADRVGQELAAAAGWNPAALPAFLRAMGREEELERGGPRRPSFLDTHPSTPERIAATTEHARELARAPLAPITPDRAGYLRRLDGLVVGARAAHGVFQGQQFLHPDLGFTLRFPDRWPTDNDPRQVAAMAPDQKALVLLELAAEGDDPLAGARALEQALKTPVVRNTRVSRVNGLPVARTQLRGRAGDGEVAVLFAWIAYGGRVYQLAGVTPVELSGHLQPAFEELVGSFRPLRPEERATVREVRLRLVEGRAGETVGALAARAGTTWSAAMVAIANGLAPDARLAAGQLLKVAVAEPYLPGRR